MTMSTVSTVTEKNFSEINKVVIQQFEDGKYVNKIAGNLKLSQSKVIHILRDSGKFVELNEVFGNPEIKTKIITNYVGGKTVHDLSRKLNISKSTVLAVIHSTREFCCKRNVNLRMHAKMTQDFENERSIRDIASEMKLKNTTVMDVLKNSGNILDRKRNWIDPELKSKIIKDYYSGSKSILEIAREFKITKSAVLTVIKVCKEFPTTRKCDLGLKIKIVDDYENGKMIRDISRDLRTGQQLVSSVLANRDSLPEEEGYALQKCIFETEKLLAAWYYEQMKNNLIMAPSDVKTMAQSIFQSVKAKEGEKLSSETFNTNHAWYNKFQCRLKYRYFRSSNVGNVSGTTGSEQRNDDDDVGDDGDIDEFISGNGYFREQVCRMNGIEQQENSATSSTGEISHPQKSDIVFEMEKLLAIWHERQIQNNLPLNNLIITDKAQQIFNAMKARESEDSFVSFSADFKWLGMFREQFHLSACKHNCDIVAEELFLDELIRLIKDEGYIPEQMFNVDETVFLWKGVPERTWMYKRKDADPGFEDRITLLLGANAAGFKLKPFLVHRSKKTSALRNISNDCLPVHIHGNLKGWVTRPAFEEWFLKCFVPSVRHYCAEKEIPFRILLLLDHTVLHPEDLDLHPNVKVVRVPTSVLSQPMNLGSVAAFRAYYLRTFFSRALAAPSPTPPTKWHLEMFWKSYRLTDCIWNVKLAWDEVSEDLFRGTWNQFLKHFLNSTDLVDNMKVDAAIQEIVFLGRALNLNIGAEEVAEFVDFTEQPLTDGDLADVIAVWHLEKEEKSSEEKVFTVDGLAGVFSKIDAAMLELKAMDPDTERFSRIEGKMGELLKCYREMHGGMIEKNLTSRNVFPTAHPPFSSAAFCSETKVAEVIKSEYPDQDFSVHFDDQIDIGSELSRLLSQ